MFSFPYFPSTFDSFASSHGLLSFICQVSVGWAALVFLVFSLSHYFIFSFDFFLCSVLRLNNCKNITNIGHLRSRLTPHSPTHARTHTHSYTPHTHTHSHTPKTGLHSYTVDCFQLSDLTDLPRAS